jgi:hypothetical protein
MDMFRNQAAESIFDIAIDLDPEEETGEFPSLAVLGCGTLAKRCGQDVIKTAGHVVWEKGYVLSRVRARNRRGVSIEIMRVLVDCRYIETAATEADIGILEFDAKRYGLTELPSCPAARVWSWKWGEVDAARFECYLMTLSQSAPATQGDSGLGSLALPWEERVLAAVLVADGRATVDEGGATAVLRDVTLWRMVRDVDPVRVVCVWRAR